MPRYLLDTNVISEITGPARNPRVIYFLDQLTDGCVFVITIHELEFGLLRLPQGQRRPRLGETIRQFLILYPDRILSAGSSEAQAAATLQIEAVLDGRTVHLADTLIVGTAKTHGLTIATRNVTAFKGLGLPVHDPWQHPGPD